MITFQLGPPAATGSLSLLALGAHPDDIEIAVGGMLLSLAARYPGMRVRYVLFTGAPETTVRSAGGGKCIYAGCQS